MWRKIYTNIVYSKSFNNLLKDKEYGEFAQLLFILMILSADDYGRLSGNMRILKLRTYAGSERSLLDFTKALKLMKDEEMIIWDEAKEVIQIRNWDKYQSIGHRRKKSEFPDIASGMVEKGSEKVKKGMKKVEKRPNYFSTILFSYNKFNYLNNIQINLNKLAKRVIEFFDKRTGRKFEGSKSDIEKVIARIREGFSVRTILITIIYMARLWGKNEKMRFYLRPETIFRASKFSGYRALALEWWKKRLELKRLKRRDYYGLPVNEAKMEKLEDEIKDLEGRSYYND